MVQQVYFSTALYTCHKNDCIAEKSARFELDVYYSRISPFSPLLPPCCQPGFFPLFNFRLFRFVHVATHVSNSRIFLRLLSKGIFHFIFLHIILQSFENPKATHSAPLDLRREKKLCRHMLPVKPPLGVQ